MNTALAYNAYQQNNMQIESPAKLIEMLYEGILRFNTQAKRALEQDNFEKKVYWINRSNAILVELINSIDFNQPGTTAHYLNGLYGHQMQLLNEANIHNDARKIDTVNKVILGLLDAWRESTQPTLAD